MQVFNIILITIFILSSNLVVGTVIINEIMYNPLGSDSGREWIEIYSEQPIDLEGWKFYEDGTNHGLSLINGTYLLEGYAVITDEYEIFLEEYTDFNATLLDSSWSSLSNSGEYIAIKDSSLNIVNEIDYSTGLANGNGKSLSLINNTWVESVPSPGYENNQKEDHEEIPTQGLKLTVYIEDEIYIGRSYTSLFKIENLDHISGITDHINLTIRYNLTHNNNLIKQDILYIEDLNSYKSSNTGEFTPLNSGNYTITGWIVNSTVDEPYKNDNIDSKIITVIDTSNIPCDIKLNITINQTIFTEGESIKFYNNLNDESFPFIVEYWIEDFFNNIYKSKYNTTNTNQKSWTTSIKEQDRVLFIKSIVYPFCNDSNLTDNEAEQMFIVKSIEDQEDYSEESSIEIIEFDETSKFGDTINVKYKIYKGNTNKYSISAYVADNEIKISETSKIHIYDKYSTQNGQISIQLDPNCDLKIEDGKYDLIIEGIDQKFKEEVKLEGIKTSLCAKYSLISSSSSSASLGYSITDFPKKISSNQQFDIQVELENEDDKDSEIEIWSYVYRGSKCYSGDREQNKRHIKIDKDSSKIITLTNNVKNLEEGEYKLKVVLNKDNQKTNKEIVKEIEVGSSEILSNNCPTIEYDPIFMNKQNNLAEYNIFNQLLCSDQVRYKRTIYESKNEEIKKLIPTFISIFAIILCILLIITKQPKSF
jgi:hypothetical protein